jgi:hypothetical protein
MDHHEMVHKFWFFICEEAVRVVLFDDIEASLVVLAGGSKVNWVW